jgi:hypothetical protein
MNFQFSPLSRDRFVPFFHLPEDALARHGAARVTANTKPGFPCRVSLEDAEIGEDILLVNFEHLDVNTPFRSRYAVYVRIAAKEARPAENQVPELLRARTLSLRAWTQNGMLAGADLSEGSAVERTLIDLFSIPDTAFIHVHFAKPGCYAARVDRA